MKSLLPSRLKRFGKADEGGALVLVALATMMLLMMAGLGVDVGYLQYQKQQMRKAADAGAIAAATVYAYSSDMTKATVSAKNEASANGFTDGSNNITVAVNNPPVTVGDPFQGNSNYIEVIVSQPRPTFFMGVTGTHSVNVSGRAVSTVSDLASGCMYALDPTSPSSFVVDGGVTLSSNCGIYVESNDTRGLRENGTSSAINVSGTGVGIGVVGNYWPQDGGTFSPTPVSGMPKFDDPLKSVAAPTFNPTNCAVNPPPDPHHYTHGVYCHGISISGNATYTFDSGTYILYGGGLTVSGNASIVGTGVTFYNTGSGSSGSYAYAPVTLNGGTASSLSAPTTGPLAGMLFFQDRAYQSTRNPDTSVINASVGTYTGSLYFPGTVVKFAGNPTIGTYSGIVAYQIEITGNTMINVSGSIPGGSPVLSAFIVE